MTLDQHVEKFRVHLAIKATVAAVLCACIGIVFHLQYGYLSPLITILVLIVFRGQTIKAGIPGMLGCLVSGTVALMITIVLADAPWAYVICMLTWLFVWMAFLTPLPMGHLLGGILTSMILFTVVLGTARVEDLLLGFWGQMFIGLAVAVAVDRVLWPSGTDDSLYETLAALFEAFATDLETLATAPPAPAAADRTSMAELHHIAHLSHFFAQNLTRNTEAEFELNFRCRLIWDRLAGLRRYLQSREFRSLRDELTDPLDVVVTDLAGHYRELADAALHRRPTPHLGEDRRGRIEGLIETVHHVQTREPNLTDRTLAAATLGQFLRHALIDHAKLAGAYNGVLDGRVIAKGALAWSREVMPDLLVWPTATAFKTSAKLILIVLVLLIGVLYLDFPGSSLVAFYGITFGLTANLGQLYMKGKAGLLGVAGGLGYGVVGVMIVVQAPHLPVLIGIFALGVFLSAYLAAGDERVAFMGLQAALITPYMFLVFEGPEWTVTNGITRTCALAISAAVAVVIQRALWPVDPLVLFRTAAAEALADIGRSWQQVWSSFRSGGPDVVAAATERADDLVLEFGQGAEFLRDSRYVVGSDHPLARTHLQLLRSLEEIFAEVRLLGRLIRLGKDNPLLDDAVAGCGKQIDTIARGLATASDYFRDRTDTAPMIDLRKRLAALDEDPDCAATFDGSDATASLEDQRQISLLIGTVGEIARSLGSVVDASLIDEIQDAGDVEPQPSKRVENDAVSGVDDDGDRAAYAQVPVDLGIAQSQPHGKPAR
jgi:uncharacterized membrane protein YccC